MRYDDGSPVVFQGNCTLDPATKLPVDVHCAPYLNYSVPGAGEWWYQQPLREVCGSDASLLVDGMMMDGASYSDARLTAVYNVQQ
jgi:hypothetical protein